MNDDQYQSIIANDREVTEASNLAAQVAAFYNGLTGAGMPDGVAGEHVAGFGTLLLARHFGICMDDASVGFHISSGVVADDDILED